MQVAPLSIGDAIEGRCTKCRKNTVHAIVSMDEGAPSEVQCSVCSRQHKFRPPTAAKKPAVRRVVNLQEAERAEWQALRPTMNPAKAVDYSMTSAYRAKAILNHPVFGLGLVERVIGPHKIEVLFEDGRKTMRCH